MKKLICMIIVEVVLNLIFLILVAARRFLLWKDPSQCKVTDAVKNTHTHTQGQADQAINSNKGALLLKKNRNTKLFGRGLLSSLLPPTAFGHIAPINIH
jgi:hypothetical protein